MDVAYINPFILGIREVFDTMIKIPLAIGRPSLREPNAPPSKLYTLSIEVKIEGKVNGVVLLHLSRPVALAVANAFASSSFNEMSPECLDALRETINMVVGSARRQMPGDGSTKMELPRMRSARDVLLPAGVPAISIPCDTSAGRFVLETALKTPIKPNPAAA